MPRSAIEFLQFVSDHYRVVAAMCAERPRFSSDEDIASFVRRFSDADANPARLISRMKQVGVLSCGAGDWSAPAYLIRFLRDLQNLFALATPEIVRASVAGLEKLARDLDARAGVFEHGAAFGDEDDTIFVLEQVRDALHAILCNVEENCNRIGVEVNDFRRMEDANRIRSRLRRLIRLHDDYLDPVIHIIDVNGAFHAVTDRLFICCSRLVGLAGSEPGRTAPVAASVRTELQWVRREVIRRAHEAKHELAPLCEAAARESRIAKGVHRAIEAIRLGQWSRLALEARLPLQDESARRLFSDQTVRNYLRMVRRSARVGPPRINQEPPSRTQPRYSVDEVAAALDREGVVEDVMLWLQRRYGPIGADEAFALLERLVALAPATAAPWEHRRDYRFDGMSVNAAQWAWRRQRGR